MGEIMSEMQSEKLAEQGYIDRAHDCLEFSRRRVRSFWDNVQHTRGGTQSARFERDVLEHKVFQRLAELDIGGRSLCFGRIDTEDETFYIGRIGVWDEDQNQLVSDWRAPVSEPFFRAGARQPMGLRRRRHFTTRGRELLGIDEERFGLTGAEDERSLPGAAGEFLGEGALRAALDLPRTGRMADITSTIQSEQDDVIRSGLRGILVVQGGPGTGKTVVALHRAAYLIYTHRFPLATQGVLVIGPNPVFLTYVEQVLPALGETGVELVAVGGLVSDVAIRGFEEEPVARLKGDVRMIQVIRQAVRDRQRPLRQPLVISHGLQRLILSAADSKRIVVAARKSRRRHNAARKMVRHGVFEALARSARSALSSEDVQEAHGDSEALREALERMWPTLSPAQLLNDLFGSRALLRSAGRGVLSPEEVEILLRPRRSQVSEVIWTYEDAPLLDEALTLLGRSSRRSGKTSEYKSSVRTYGHVVIDEAQDLSPMQLRMIGRRCPTASFTLVGDIAQSSGAWAHSSWKSVLENLTRSADARSADARIKELAIGYRVPHPIMELAAAVGREDAPDLMFPNSVKRAGSVPRICRVSEGKLGEEVAESVRAELSAGELGNLAVICSAARVEHISRALTDAGLEHGVAASKALEMKVTVISARFIKGLEVDVVVLVEPSLIVSESSRGMRLLYVALTRATRRLLILHSAPLPVPLAKAAAEQGVARQCRESPGSTL